MSDFHTVPNHIPSLCIPRVFPNIDEKRIRRIFAELGLGEIHHIDIVNKTTEKGEQFNRIFIHFQSWFSNANANAARDRLLNGKEIKIVYDDPWFWKVSAYRQNNHHHHQHNSSQTQQQQQVKAKPRIQFDDEQPRQQPQKQTPIAPRLPPKRKFKPVPRKTAATEVEDGEIV